MYLRSPLLLLQPHNAFEQENINFNVCIGRAHTAMRKHFCVARGAQVLRSEDGINCQVFHAEIQPLGDEEDRLGSGGAQGSAYVGCIGGKASSCGESGCVSLRGPPGFQDYHNGASLGKQPGGRCGGRAFGDDAARLCIAGGDRLAFA